MPHFCASLRRLITSVSKSKKNIVTVFAEERADRDRLASARVLLCGERMRVQHWKMLPLTRVRMKRRRKGGVRFAYEYERHGACEKDDE